MTLDLGIVDIRPRAAPRYALGHQYVAFACGCQSWWLRGIRSERDPRHWTLARTDPCRRHLPC